MKLEDSVSYLKKKHTQFKIKAPDLHVVLGSVAAAAIDEIQIENKWRRKGEISFAEIPGFNPATAPGHKGSFYYFENVKTGKVLCIQAGRVHGYEGITARAAVRPVMAHCLLGTKTFVLTNAAGSLRREMDSGSVMLIKDHVNLTGQNPLAGPNPLAIDGREIGPRFPDLSAVYDIKLKDSLRACLLRENFEIHEGIYLGLLGPSFETPAETSLFTSWGMSAVGMSTVWEAISLKHAGATVSGVSLITNLAAGFIDQPLDHFEFEKQLKGSAQRFARAFFDFAEREIGADV